MHALVHKVLHGPLQQLSLLLLELSVLLLDHL